MENAFRIGITCSVFTIKTDTGGQCAVDVVLNLQIVANHLIIVLELLILQ